MVDSGDPDLILWSRKIWDGVGLQIEHICSAGKGTFSLHPIPRLHVYATVPNHETSMIRAKPDPICPALFELLLTEGSEESKDGQPPPTLDPKPECAQPPPAALKGCPMTLANHTHMTLDTS